MITKNCFNSPLIIIVVELPTLAGFGLPLVELTVLSEESARLRFVVAGLDIEMLPFLSFRWLPVNNSDVFTKLPVAHKQLKVQINNAIKTYHNYATLQWYELFKNERIQEKNKMMNYLLINMTWEIKLFVNEGNLYTHLWSFTKALKLQQYQ